MTDYNFTFLLHHFLFIPVNSTMQARPRGAEAEISRPRLLYLHVLYRLRRRPHLHLRSKSGTSSREQHVYDHGTRGRYQGRLFSYTTLKQSRDQLRTRRSGRRYSPEGHNPVRMAILDDHSQPLFYFPSHRNRGHCYCHSATQRRSGARFP